MKSFVLLACFWHFHLTPDAASVMLFFSLGRPTASYKQMSYSRGDQTGAVQSVVSNSNSRKKKIGAATVTILIILLLLCVIFALQYHQPLDLFLWTFFNGRDGRGIFRLVGARVRPRQVITMPTVVTSYCDRGWGAVRGSWGSVNHFFYFFIPSKTEDFVLFFR